VKSVFICNFLAIACNQCELGKLNFEDRFYVKHCQPLLEMRLS